MVHDRLHCINSLEVFLSLTLFGNKACIQFRTGIKLKSCKGMLPGLLHFICQRFARVGLL